MTDAYRGMSYGSASQRAKALLKRAADTGSWFDIPEKLIELREIMQRRVARAVHGEPAKPDPVWCADRFPNCVFAAMPPPYVPLCRVTPSECKCHREQNVVALAVIQSLGEALVEKTAVIVQAGGEPCPTCGFRITVKDPEPFQFREDDIAAASPTAIVICPHGQCPHDAACVGAGTCTEGLTPIPQAGRFEITNSGEPAYLPLRKTGAIGEGGDA